MNDVESVRPLSGLFAKWEGYLDDTGRYCNGGFETSQRQIVRVAVCEFWAMFGEVPIAKYHRAFPAAVSRRARERLSLSRGGIHRKIGILPAKQLASLRHAQAMRDG